MRMVPLKRLCKIISGAGFPHDAQGQSDNEIPFYKVGSLSAADNRGMLDGAENSISREMANGLGAVIVPPNSCLMAKIGAATLLQRVVMTMAPACFDNNMMAIVPNIGVHPRYLFYILQTINLQPLMNPGAVPNLNMDFFRSIQVPYHSYKDQQKIAFQLDNELAEIDELIADQQILSRLQHEKFRSHLSRSIQPGDPDIFSSGRAENKYDGTIWRRTKLGHVMEVNGGQVDPRVSPYSAMTLIAPNHIESGTGKLLYTESAEEQGADSGKYQVKEGQVIFSKIRPTLLKSTIAPEDCLCSADMYGLNGKPRVLNNEFLMYYLLSDRFLAQAAVNSDRVAMPKLNRESLSELSIWLPDITHQAMVSESIKRTQSRMNLLAGDSSAFLELLSKKVLATTRKVLEA